MTEVTLVRDKTGRFKAFNASGHAGFAEKGSDIVCSAVTVLLRTAIQLLSETDGVVINADVAAAGALSMEVTYAEPEMEQRLICIADFLELGIGSLEAEYPQNIALRKENEH